VKRGHLDVPVIGVAKAGWKPRTAPRPRRTASRSTEGSIPRRFRVWVCCASRWRTQGRSGIRRELGSAGGRRTTWPSRCVEWSWGSSARRAAPAAPGSSSRSRPAATSPPRGAHRVLLGAFDETSIFPIDHYSEAAVHHMLSSASPNAFLESFGTQPRRERADHHGEIRDPGPSAFYDETGAIRDVFRITVPVPEPWPGASCRAMMRRRWVLKAIYR